jgi:hypothetical protein
MTNMSDEVVSPWISSTASGAPPPPAGRCETETRTPSGVVSGCSTVMTGPLRRVWTV